MIALSPLTPFDVDHMELMIQVLRRHHCGREMAYHIIEKVVNAKDLSEDLCISKAERRQVRNWLWTNDPSPRLATVKKAEADEVG